MPKVQSDHLILFQVGGDDYSLIVNLRRLHQLQLNKAVISESLFADQVELLENYNNIDDEVGGSILMDGRRLSCASGYSHKEHGAGYTTCSAQHVSTCYLVLKVIRFR